MAAVTPPRPLAESDDRSQFDCGRESLNNWFQRHAWANHASDMSRVSVITDATMGRVVGYVALSAAQIERAYLPKAQQRNRPDPVRRPAARPARRRSGLSGQGICRRPAGRRPEDRATGFRKLGAWASLRIRSMTA